MIERSSISSFSHDVPEGPWWIGLAVGAAFAVLLGAGLEFVWRQRGHEPNVVDDKALWALERTKVDLATTSVIAFLGNSHSQVGVDTTTVRTHCPGCSVRQLSTSGSNPAATLKDLGADSRFRGTVIANVSATCFEAGLEQTIYVSQQPFVDYYHHVAQWEGLLNRQLSVEVQSRLAFVAPQLSMRTLLYSRTIPNPLYVQTLADRSRRADYAVFDRSAIRASRVKFMSEKFAASPRPTPTEWLRRVGDMEADVEAIQGRGGKVAFVHFPLSGEIWNLEKQRYPRSDFWNRFAATTKAKTVHFEDYSALRKFDCPDGQHLDRRDAPEFTSELCGVLFELGVLGRRD